MFTTRSRSAAVGPAGALRADAGEAPARNPAPRGAPAVAVVVVALLLCALGASPARADRAPTMEEIVEGLKSSPVYVDESYRSELPLSARRALAEEAGATGLRLSVVLVRLKPGDAWNGDHVHFGEALRDALGRPDGEHQVVIVTTAQKDRTLHAFEWPKGDRHQAGAAARATSMEHELRGVPLRERLSRTIELVGSGEGMVALDRVLAEKISGGKRKGGDESAGEDDSAAGRDSGPSWGWAALLIPVVLLAGWWAAARRRADTALPLAPHVFASARQESEGALRRRAKKELLALGQELGAHRSTADDRTDPAPLRLALDAYAAAGRVLDDATGTPDLAGVLALVTEGRDALEEDDRARAEGASRKAAERPLPLCFFDPLHGRAERRHLWRPIGRRDTLDIAACAHCLELLALRRSPRMLADHHDGTGVPYAEVPAEQSLWAATGYGSFGDEPLAVRVQRGDFTRAAAARARAARD
ncbi:hypothetical protein MTQ01_11500 [Streptomyces sp. XM4193]|uniref:hypothetical protein n=1 Tax=Streptomyces sp. XM4193 TaxID=2929782 RepID=UPI001FF79653|nr:hypothetical protein [Streptomyces sp. XM4193]MCK1796627.1 hypothetical protein [Streptomyces sp. XM4193]